MRLEDLQGEILSLSKDQHGCRYLQKKLEEEVPEHRDMIFRETYGHFPELMTGKFISTRLAAICGTQGLFATIPISPS
jgi:hypothetical protein